MIEKSDPENSIEETSCAECNVFSGIISYNIDVVHDTKYPVSTRMIEDTI